MIYLFVLLLAISAVFLTVVLMKMSSDKREKRIRRVKPDRDDPPLTKK